MLISEHSYFMCVCLCLSMSKLNTSSPSVQWIFLSVYMYVRGVGSISGRRALCGVAVLLMQRRSRLFCIGTISSSIFCPYIRRPLHTAISYRYIHVYSHTRDVCISYSVRSCSVDKRGVYFSGWNASATSLGESAGASVCGAAVSSTLLSLHRCAWCSCRYV